MGFTCENVHQTEYVKRKKWDGIMAWRISVITLLLIIPELITGFHLIQSTMTGAVIQPTAMEKPARVAITDAIHARQDDQTADTILYEPALYMIPHNTLGHNLNITEQATLKGGFGLDFKTNASMYDSIDFEWVPFTEKISSFETFGEKPEISSFWMEDDTITLPDEERISSLLGKMDLGGVGDE